MALILTYSIWHGPSSRRIREMASRPSTEDPPTSMEQEGFYTRLSLAEAIRAMKRYELDFNRKYADSSAINIKLLQVSQVADLHSEDVKSAGMRKIEGLLGALSEGSL